MRRNRGFSLVELIAIMIIIGILAATVTSRMIPHTTLQLQAGRDLTIAALFSAQQEAMAQLAPVRLSTSGNTIDIRVDSNNDGNFAVNESVRAGGTQYPVILPGGVALTAHNFVFNYLGHTTAGNIQVNKNASSITVTVTGTGYAY